LVSWIPVAANVSNTGCSAAEHIPWRGLDGKTEIQFCRWLCEKSEQSSYTRRGPPWRPAEATPREGPISAEKSAGTTFRHSVGPCD